MRLPTKDGKISNRCRCYSNCLTDPASVSNLELEQDQSDPTDKRSNAGGEAAASIEG